MPAQIALLVLVVVVLLWRAVSRERRDLARFRQLRSTVLRRKTLGRWILEAWIVLGGLSAVVLFAVWTSVPDALRDARGLFPFLSDDAAGGFVVGGTIAVVIGLIVPVFLLRGRIDEIPAVGNIRALLPRNRGELPYGAGLGLTAGIVEEVLFRLALPALVYAVSGNGAVAFVTCVVLFGLLHLYQGLKGMLAATVLGVIFTVFYVLSGNILLVMALHVLFDLRSLVLIPVVLMGVGHRGEVETAKSST
ncbi:MAG TPA: CPBP family intramembrane glutamic endopeptidase [Pseudolysinimonas sp.]|nr:CPBP family intramembrane glutamic endopeptidase [Pseudolysinimonas sp.]